MIDDAQLARLLSDLDPGERAGSLRIIQAYVEGGRALNRVAEAMVRPEAVVPPAEALQARANAERRERFIREYGAYTGEEVARLAGSRAGNAAQYASRLKRRGLVASIRWFGRILYPRFQFSDDGRPLPAVADVLRTFDGQLSEWQVVFWFVSGNGHLGDRAPIDVIGKDPRAVLAAAREEIAPVVE